MRDEEAMGKDNSIYFGSIDDHGHTVQGGGRKSV